MLRIMPFLALLFFVNYLDRVNVGLAGPNGMNHELGLSATAFGFASGIFFLGYVTCEIPSNLALHRFGARRWLARIMLTWGIVATALAFVSNLAALVVMRFLLGVAEAGFAPGILLYLTYWFPAAQRSQAFALFIAAAPVSLAIGSPISGLLIAHGDSIFGLSGWRFMMIVEGIPAIVLAFVTWFYLTDRPEQASWLSESEKNWLTTQLENERRMAEAVSRWTLRQVLTHPRILGLGCIYFTIVYGLYALGFFLPTIIAGFGQEFGTKLSTVQASLVTAVPYLVATCAMVMWARHSDRTGERKWHVALPMILGGVAIPSALYLGNVYAAMIAVTVCAVGVFAALPAFWALPSTFLTGAASAGGLALINSLGNVAGFAAPNITGVLNDLTGTQRSGLWVVGVCMFIGAFTVLRTKITSHPDSAPL
ncbi:MAG: MFS transporter [Mycobacteriaceae bacterium]|nr:MFS transporter [Mycobacteriaceae bacterium]